MTTEFIKLYKQQRDMLKKRFEDEKTGDQTLFTDQLKLFKPLIESQKETSKAIQDKIVTSQEAASNALVPIARDIRKGLEQIDTLHNLPFYQGIEDVSQSTPQKDTDVINVNLDVGLLNETHRENLQDLKLDLPSEVQKNDTIEYTLNRIKTINRSIGQKLGVKSKSTEKERDIMKSQKETLKIYKESILALKGAKKFTKKSGEGLQKRKLCKLKRGRGRPKKYLDIISYNNADDLCMKLKEQITAKEAGNTVLFNSIIK